MQDVKHREKRSIANVPKAERLATNGIDYLRQRQNALGSDERNMPHSWWYYAKKRYALFPGVSEAICAEFLRSYYARRSKNVRFAGKFLNMVTYAGFHAWLPFRAKSIAKKYRLSPEWATKAKEIGRQRFVDPNDLALFRIDKAETLDHYLRRFEHADINRRINPAHWRPECALGNKIDFYLRCREHDITTPNIAGLIVDGHLAFYEPDGQTSFIVKPCGGEGGVGIFGISGAEKTRDKASFEEAVRQKAGQLKGEWLVQDKLLPHPDIQGLSLSALPTARISTMRNEHGDIEVVTSVFRFPSDPESLIDNIKAGGLMAPIDQPTGILGEGCAGRDVGDFSQHPNTGYPIKGLQLPCWEASKALAQQAHAKAFPEYALVGWDVAITPDGPFLIEGNGKPCVIVAQRAPRKGIGATRFGELVAYHLGQAAAMP